MANPRIPNGLGSPQSIHQSSTTAWHKVGQKGFFDDGRVFYYTHSTSAAAIEVGKLHVRADLTPNHQECATTTGGLVVGNRNIIVGAITPGATLIAVNEYAEGWLGVTDAGGEGHIYKIASNSAFTSGTADGSVELYDPIVVASDANTTVSLYCNGYRNPALSGANQQDVAVGVPTFTLPIGSTTPYYGWLQTWGECLVWCDEAVATFGQAVVPGTTVPGAIEEDDTATTASQEPLIGYNIAALVDTEYQCIDLRIRP